MSGTDRARDDFARTAVVETTHADAATARTVAAAIAPDNTDDIRTASEGRTVTTRIERGTTGGPLASVADYLVNPDVADEVAATGREADDDEATDDATAAAGATGAVDTTDTDDADGIRDTADTRDTRDTADTHDT